ncbi:MAG: hypothetical protein COA33_009490 [Fluviicola sp.]|nr:hypothetical protein [Fluviicola sp.]
MQEVEFQEQIVTNEITATLRQDGIVHLFIHDNTDITKDTLDNILVSLKKLKDGPIPLIVEAGEFVTVSKEAKLYAHDYESKINVESRALITKNLAQKIMVNFYYKNRPIDSPFKEFRTIEAGVEWLKREA